MRRAYRARRQATTHRTAFRADYLRRIVLQPRVAILLYDDAEPTVCAESQVHGFGIGREAIDRNLRATITAARLCEVIGQPHHETPGVVSAALAEQVARDEPAVL